MNINKETRGIVEAAIITGIIVTFGILGMYMPFLGILLFIIPMPLIVIGQRHGVKYAVMSLVVATLITIGFSSPVMALYVVALPGTVSIAISIMINRKAEASKIVLVGTLVSTLSTVISINLAASLLGISITESMQEIFTQSMDMQNYFGQITNSNPEVVMESQEMIKRIEKLALTLIPTIIIMASFFTSLINYKLATMVLKRTGNDVIALKPFKEFRLSRNASVGLLLILLLSYITSKTNIVDGETLMVNVSILFQMIFVFQGLAVAVFYFFYYKLPKIVMVFAIPIILFSNLGVNVMAMIGIFDLFMDLRKYSRDTR